METRSWGYSQNMPSHLGNNAGNHSRIDSHRRELSGGQSLPGHHQGMAGSHIREPAPMMQQQNSGVGRQQAVPPQVSAAANMLPALSQSLNSMINASQALHGSMGNLRQLAELGYRWGESADVDQQFRNVMDDIYSTMEGVHQARMEAIATIGINHFVDAEYGAPEIARRSMPSELHGGMMRNPQQNRGGVGHPGVGHFPGPIGTASEETARAGEGQALLLEVLKNMVSGPAGGDGVQEIANLLAGQSAVSNNGQQQFHHQRSRNAYHNNHLQNPWTSPSASSHPLPSSLEHQPQLRTPSVVESAAPETNLAPQDVARIVQMRAAASSSQQALLRGGRGSNVRNTIPPPSSSLWKVAEESEPQNDRPESPNVEDHDLSDSADAISSSSTQQNRLPGVVDSSFAANLLGKIAAGDRNALASLSQMHGSIDSGQASHVRTDRLQQRPKDNSNFVVKNTFIECDNGDEKPQGLSSIHFASEQVRRHSPEDFSSQEALGGKGNIQSMLSQQEFAHI